MYEKYIHIYTYMCRYMPVYNLLAYRQAPDANTLIHM